MFTKFEPLPGEQFYAQVPVHWIRDPRLRGLDKAILAYIQTHQVGYQITIKQLVAEMYESRDTIYASVARLVDLEYFVRSQPRGEGGTFGQVDYTFGPAASAPTYDRNWGAGSVSAGRTASGFSVSGSSVSGSAVSGGSDTKKNKERRSDKEDHLPPHPPPESVQLEAGPDQEEEGGEDSDRRQDPTPETLAAELAQARPRFTARRIVRVLLEQRDAGRPWPLVVAAARICLTDLTTHAPSRLAEAGPWWDRAAALLAPPGPEPEPRRMRLVREPCPDLACDSRHGGHGLIEIEQPGRGTVLTPCPQCNPAAVRVSA